MTLALLVIAGLGLLYVGPLLLSQRSSRLEAQKLMQDGALGEAEILGYIPGKGGLWVEYEFTPSGACDPVRCKKCLTTAWKRLPVGSKVAVRYKARFPSISVLVPYADSQVPS